MCVYSDPDPAALHATRVTQARKRLLGAMGKATGDGLMSDLDEGIEKQLPDQLRSLRGCHNMFTGIQLRAAIVFWLHYLARNILEDIHTALTAPAKRNRMLDLGAARNWFKRFLLSATPGMLRIHSSGPNA